MFSIKDSSNKEITLNAEFWKSHYLLTMDDADFKKLLNKVNAYCRTDMTAPKVKECMELFQHFPYIGTGKTVSVKNLPRQVADYVADIKETYEHSSDVSIKEVSKDVWSDSSLILTIEGEENTYSYGEIFERYKILSEVLTEAAECSCKWFNSVVDEQVNELRKKRKDIVSVEAKKYDQNLLSAYFWYKIKFHYEDNPISLSVFYNLTDKSAGEYDSLIRVAIEVHESQTKKISSFYKEKVNQAIDILINDYDEGSTCFKKYKDARLMCAYADSYEETVYEKLNIDSLRLYKKESTDNNRRLHLGYSVLNKTEDVDDEEIGKRIKKAFKYLVDICDRVSYSTRIEREIYETLYIRRIKQMVLHGAPGTGKTFGAKRYVNQSVKNAEIQSKLIQFHPSYDYSDFVEGIRPITIERDGKKEMVFVKVDGDFKSFCRQIVESNLKRVLRLMDIDTILKCMCSRGSLEKYGLNKDEIEIKLKSDSVGLLDKKTTELDGDSIAFLYALMDLLFMLAFQESINAELSDDEKNMLSLFRSVHDTSQIKYEDEIDEQESALYDEEELDEFLGETMEAVDDANDEESEYVDEDDDNGEVPYFFIVDEINRADISKVLGELMYGFEYRGIQNRFPTQYAQISVVYSENKGVYEPLAFDCFKDGFFVPENLVIIGTMNDIDKSVESFDFAMRRRFHWIHIKAEAVMEEVLKGMFSKTVDVKRNAKTISTLAERMKNMNKQLVKEGSRYGLDEDYMIGPDYLRDFFNYKQRVQQTKRANTLNVALERVFDLSIEPTIREYLRGQKQDKVKALVDNCKKALVGKNVE